MKNYFTLFSLVFIVFLLISGCSVNSNSGCINLVNNTDKDVVLKIGSSTQHSISKGTSNENYFYQTITGEAKSDGFEDCFYIDRNDPQQKKYTDVTLKTGYRYTITLYKNNGYYYIGVGNGYKPGEDLNNAGSIHYPFTNTKN